MSTESMRCLPSLLSVLLIVGITVTPAWAGTTFISFENDVGLLTDQSPPNVLTAPPGDPKHGVFSGAGFVFLEDNSVRVDTTKPNEVSIVARLAPFLDIDSGVTLCLVIADKDDTGIAVLACFSADNSGVGTLKRPDGSFINLGINLWGATQDYTLTYNTQTELATLMRQNNGVSVSLPVAFGIDDPTSVVVGITTDGTARVRNFTAFGPGIPDYPVVGDPLDPDNPWVDFSMTSSGTGAENSPFMFLAEALAVANPGATISIVPGTDSTEKPMVNQSVTLANSDFAGGSVSIGVSARRDADLSSEGFISRGSSVRRR
ncbi:MAG: hypothetical protein QGD90_11415 [Candidatus Hydrogenedentes bacterium]|nr:hypothetical protein [Candidatus Hydrogenedentota bacterium]